MIAVETVAGELVESLPALAQFQAELGRDLWLSAIQLRHGARQLLLGDPVTCQPSDAPAALWELRLLGLLLASVWVSRPERLPSELGAWIRAVNAAEAAA